MTCKKINNVDVADLSYGITYMKVRMETSQATP